MERITRWLGKEVNVVIDRPLGSKHPDHDLIYPINYGFIPGTLSGDGEEIDAYVIGEFEPLKQFNGIVIAVIERKDDNEFKLVVCRDAKRYNKDQITCLVEFQERFFHSKVFISDFSHV